MAGDGAGTMAGAGTTMAGDGITAGTMAGDGENNIEFTLELIIQLKH
jgi:hypothetical protein